MEGCLIRYSGKTGDFANGSIPRNILALALPIMVAEIVHVLYNLIDKMYISHIPEIGGYAFTGVGITLPLITLISAFASLCGNGGAPLMSAARGEGKAEHARRIQETSFTMLIITGLLLSAVLYFIKTPVLRLMGADADTMTYASDYFGIYLIGTVFVMISLGMNSFINAQGFSRIGMCTVLIGAISNAVLDPIFIFAFDLGVKGAATATVISQFFSAMWVFCFLSGKRSILQLRKLRIDKKIMRQILSLGVSGFSFKMTNSVTQAVVNSTLKLWGGALGTSYIGAMSIINSLREVVSQPISGITGGSQPVISYNYGAKRYDRVCEGIRFMLCSALLYNSVAWAILMLFPVALASIFAPEPEVLALYIPCMRIYFGAFFMMSFQTAGQNTYVALNKPKLAVFFSLFRKVVLVLPLTILLPYTGLGVKGVFWAEMISQAVGASACFITMRIVVWRKLEQKAKDGSRT